MFTIGLHSMHHTNMLLLVSGGVIIVLSALNSPEYNVKSRLSFPPFSAVPFLALS